MVTVYYNGSGLLVDDDVAEHLNVEDGYTIKTESEFREVLRSNCKAGILACQAKLLIQEKPIKP